MPSHFFIPDAVINYLLTTGDGAVSGIIGIVYAIDAWFTYLSSAAALRRLKSATSVSISDFRYLISVDGDEKLVSVRGFVKNAGDRVLKAEKSADVGVVVQRVQSRVYQRWQGIYMRDLRAYIGTESWKEEERTSSMRSVPFILMDDKNKTNSEHVHVSLNNSSHPLPLNTIYQQYSPVKTTHTFLNITFAIKFSDALLDEEKILPVGKEISAIGICRIYNGEMEIRACPELPYFLCSKTKDELELDLTKETQYEFWCAIIVGTLSIGILGYAAYKNWWRMREWRERRRHAQEIQDEVQAYNSEVELENISEEELCVICLTRQRRYVFIPCGHLVCCLHCAISVEQNSSSNCPVCRQRVCSFIRVYSN